MSVCALAHERTHVRLMLLLMRLLHLPGAALVWNAQCLKDMRTQRVTHVQRALLLLPPPWRSTRRTHWQRPSTGASSSTARFLPLTPHGAVDLILALVRAMCACELFAEGG